MKKNFDKNNFDTDTYDRIEALFELGSTISVDYPRDVLFNGDGSSVTGQISSFRHFVRDEAVLMNAVLIAEDYRDPCSPVFAQKIFELHDALVSAAKARQIDVRGPAQIYLAQMKGETEFTIGPAGSNSFGVYLFAIISPQSADPREEIRKLGPLLIKAKIFSTEDEKAFQANLDVGPLHPAIQARREAGPQAAPG